MNAIAICDNASLARALFCVPASNRLSRIDDIDALEVIHREQMLAIPPDDQTTQRSTSAPELLDPEVPSGF